MGHAEANAKQTANAVPDLERAVRIVPSDGNGEINREELALGYRTARRRLRYNLMDLVK